MDYSVLPVAVLLAVACARPDAFRVGAATDSMFGLVDLPVFA